jgi:hypothetical protein
MTPQEHAAQVSAVRASLLLDSARSPHDVYPTRAREIPEARPLSATPSLPALLAGGSRALLDAIESSAAAAPDAAQQRSTT